MNMAITCITRFVYMRNSFNNVRAWFPAEPVCSHLFREIRAERLFRGYPLALRSARDRRGRPFLEENFRKLTVDPRGAGSEGSGRAEDPLAHESQLLPRIFRIVMIPKSDGMAERECSHAKEPGKRGPIAQRPR